MQALRIARPTDQLDVVAAFYRDGVGLDELSRFDGHDGFSGRILGRPDLGWHLELVAHAEERYGVAPNPEHLLAIYHDDTAAHAAAVGRIAAAGGVPTRHPNPWWDAHGGTWLDPDGYAVALVRAPWRPIAQERR